MVKTYGPLIYKYARSVGLDPNEAADISQTVWMQLLRSLPSFQRKQRGSFRRWLRVVTVNKVNDFYEQKQKLVEAERIRNTQSLGQIDLSDESASPAILSERQLKLQLILQRIQQEVSPKTWEAFELMMFGEKTSVEIGTILELSPDAVRMSKRRVLDKIRQLWETFDESLT
ncbi:MAG: sigma-70 family RNA polymerase sigma factor [Planctomycetaceae bacterium]